MPIFLDVTSFKKPRVEAEFGKIRLSEGNGLDDMAGSVRFVRGSSIIPSCKTLGLLMSIVCVHCLFLCVCALFVFVYGCLCVPFYVFLRAILREGFVTHLLTSDDLVL